MYCRHLDDKSRLSYNFSGFTQPHGCEVIGDCTNVAAADQTSGKIDVDHTNINNKFDHKCYYNSCDKGFCQDKTRYIDGNDFWTNKMNDYRSSSPLSLRKPERRDRKIDVKIRDNGTKGHSNSSPVSSSCNTHPSLGAVSCKMIQVAPGEYMRLRGAEETWKAVQQDFYIPGTCICCQETIFCIQDALFVLCPMCDVVSPSLPGKILISDGYKGGVGLGFVMDELIQWQKEILAARKQT
jgi:hypothetical protein